MRIETDYIEEMMMTDGTHEVEETPTQQVPHKRVVMSFEDQLVQIAGKNALSIENGDIANLSKCCRYLMKQLRLTASLIDGDCLTPDERIKGIRENAEKILNS